MQPKIAGTKERAIAGVSWERFGTVLPSVLNFIVNFRKGNRWIERDVREKAGQWQTNELGY